MSTAIPTATQISTARKRIALRAMWIAFAATASVTAHAAEPVAIATKAEFDNLDPVHAVTFAERIVALRSSILRVLAQGGHLLNLEAPQSRFGTFAPKEFRSFDSNNDLFLSRAEQQYRDTLRVLIAQQQLRLSLNNDVHFACELNQYQPAQRAPEPELKLALQFKFR